MAKTDPALAAIRNVRPKISREFNNNPARLIAHYIELRRRIEKSKIVQGPHDARMPTQHRLTRMLPNQVVEADEAHAALGTSLPSASRSADSTRRASGWMRGLGLPSATKENLR